MHTRRNDIDWLRIFAVLLLFSFHTAMIFDGGRYYVVNVPPSPVAGAFGEIVHQWHMPLFFLLAGMSTCLALGFRSGGDYLKERFKRLLIPLTFGTLVIVPPQVYIALRDHGGYEGSFFAFYPKFFNGVAPSGNFEWGHLWFLAYLLVYSLLALPVFLWLRGAAGQRVTTRLAALCDRPGALFLFALPLFLVEGTLRPRWPGWQNLVDDWANFFWYLLYFGYGYLICTNERFKQAIDKHLKLAATVVLSVLFMYAGTKALGVEVKWGYTWDGVLLQFVRAVFSWAWLLMFLGLGQRYLNCGGKVLAYAREAAYPVYILHQTVLVWIGFYVVRWPLGTPAKFAIINISALLTTLLVYDLAVRRANPVRFLFGMKPRKQGQ